MHFINDTTIPGGAVDGGLNGRFSASILFIDISGFTPLTETLFQYQHQGAEILSALLHEVFGEMVCQVYSRQGFIPMFAGDGFFAVFPGDSSETVERAWQTAVAIQQHFRSARGPFNIYVTPYGNFEIGVKIGMAMGEVSWGILYTDHQTNYYFRGESLYDCTDAEQTAVTGDIVAHESLLNRLRIKPQTTPTEIPSFHKLAPEKRPFPCPETNKKLALPAAIEALLRSQVPTEAVSPDFRFLCPVFISFQSSHPDWPILVQKTMRLAANYGGTFNRLEFGDKGDIMLLWFGAPVSHENDVERACKFLLALEQETAVPWRAGLTYGLVWAGNRGGEAYSEYGCVGDSMNTAARIVGQTNWGQVWLDESAAKELPIGYSLQALGEFQFKGKQKPRGLFRLTGVSTSTEITPTMGMVGRQIELQQCHDALEPMFNGRFAGIITIQGQAGIGKSRFAAALRKQLAGQVNWLTCPADDILSESLNPFQTMLATWCNQSPEHEPAENWKQFISHLNILTTNLNNVSDERAPSIYTELKRSQTTLASLAGITLNTNQDFLDPERNFTNNLLVLTAFFKAQSLVKPLVLHIEDAHWLDEESWQYLVDVPRRLANFPIILLMTGRPDGPFAIPLQPHTTVLHTHIALQPFTVVEIQAICQLLLGNPVTDTLLAFLKSQSQGNPFFVEQLIIELNQQGAFTREESGETAVLTLGNADKQILPQTLNALLTSRLDRLSMSVKTVVQTASVLGQRFPLSLLAAMHTHDEHLLDKIAEIAKHKIWHTHPDAHIQFQHSLLRDVAYTMQPQAQRCKIHHKAAATLETVYRNDLSTYYREIGHHYHAAYENGLLSDRRAARHYLRMAGEQAAAMYENETAVSYFSTALALSVRDTKKFPLYLTREAIYHLQGRRELQIKDLNTLADIAQILQNQALMTTVMLRRARYAEALGDYTQSVVSAQRALSYATNKIQEAEACLQWGLALIPKGDYQEATQQLQEALLKAEETEQYDLQSKTLVNLGKIAVRQSNYQEAIRSYHRVLRICQASGDKQMQGEVLNDLGELARFQNDFETAVTHLNAALAITQEIGDRRTESSILKNLGGIAGARYQFEEARKNFSRDLQISHEIGDLDGEGQALGNLGYIEVILGNYTQAETYIQQDWDIACYTGNRHNEVVALALWGWCENAQNKWDKAASHFERGKQIAVDIGDQEMEMYCLGGLGNAFTGLNRAEEGAAYLQQSFVGYRMLRMELFALESMAGWVRAQLILGNALATMPIIEELLEYLHTIDPFSGADSPLLILWTCYQALLANNDDRAQTVLKGAVDLLKTAVSHIPDDATRKSFLQNVPWHQKILLASGEQVFYN